MPIVWTSKRVWRKSMRGLSYAGYVAVIAMVVFAGVNPPRKILADSLPPYDFSVPGDYGLSDGTKIEVSSSTARVKNQQYTTDGNTAAYWRFDETSGNTAEDQSANNNDLAFSTTSPCAGASWADGKIAADGVDISTNGGVDTAGLTGCVTAADSASLSLSAQTTLEAYVKFSGAFDSSNTLSRGVIDKGNYRLYFDAGDGKLKFEMDDDDTKTWSKVGGSTLAPTTPGINGNEGTNGSWRQFVPSVVQTLVEFSGSLYVGTVGNGANFGTGEVWKYSGSNQTWSKVGGDGNGSTNWDYQTEAVYSLVVHSGALYAGLGLTAGDAEIWRYSGSGTTWTKVAGGGVNSSWTVANGIEAVYAMASDGTYLYAGTGNTVGSAVASDGDVWRCTNCGTSPSWTIIGGSHNSTGANVNSSWGITPYNANTATESVRSMVVMGSHLYVGLGDTVNASHTDAEIWRCTNCGTSPSWTKVAGDGTPAAWANNVYEMVFSLATNGTTLWAGLGSGASDADVWECTSCGTSPSWTQIGGNEVNGTKPNWNTNYEIVRGLVYNSTDSKLYASLGDTAGEAEVWRYDTTTWVKVGGDAVGAAGKKSWDAYFVTPEAAAGTNSTKELAYIGTFNNKLVVGTGNTPQDAEVWLCDANCASGSTPDWSVIGGWDFRSWGSSNLSWVTSMSINNGNLYVGTGSTNKHATIWEYNGSTWTQVGGGNLNLPAGEYWTNYEYVLSMTSFKGDLYAGFGSTADDADVWKYSGGSWTQVGGVLYSSTVNTDTINNSWTNINNIEEVVTLAADENYLYAGTGNTATDGDVWRFDGSTWGTHPIGGSRNDTNVLVNNSWAAGTFERVQTLKVANGFVIAGLGSSAGDAELWRWNGTNWGSEVSPNTTRNRIGGDGDATFATWNRSDQVEVVRESIRSIAVIDETIYVATGDTNDGVTHADAEVWACTNCFDTSVYAYAGTKPDWTKIGGDGVNFSWDNLIYEQVTSLVSFKGQLYASLGINNAGADYDSELWMYDGANWTKVGGDAQTADTWSGTYEVAGEMIVYNGRLYAGLGTTNNTATAADAEVWEYGGNTSKILSSTTASWSADRWYHIAGSYDGGTARLYICDSTDLGACTGTAQTSASWGAIQLADNSLPVAIGALHGSLSPDRSLGGFIGTLDEVRISNNARTSFNYTQYPSVVQTVQPTTLIPRTGKASWEKIVVSETLNGGTIKYRFSTDNGVTWQWKNGVNWELSNSPATGNTPTANEVDLTGLTMTNNGLLWQAALLSNGDQRVTLNSVTVHYVPDTTAPNLVTSVIGNDGTWFNRANPQFSWSAPTDDPGVGEGASGVEGYWVYFGTDAAAVPKDDGAFQTATTFTGTPIADGDTLPYYLRLQVEDYAGNITDDITGVTDYFRDTEKPDPVASVNALSGAGGDPITTDTWYNHAAPQFSWSAPTDDLPAPNPNNEIASGIKGYYVYFGTDPAALPRTSGTFQIGTSFTAGSLTSGETYYLRIQSRDKALNTSDDVTGVLDAFTYKYDGGAPTPPATISVSPASYTAVNNYTFIWPVTGPSAPSDPDPIGSPGASGLLGYQYKTGASSGSLSDWSSVVTDGSGEVTIPDAAYTEGPNTFYLRYVDVSGNVSTAITATYYYAGSAPTAPLNLQVTPVTTEGTPSLENAFAFSWDAPATSVSPIKQYRFAVNKLPLTPGNTTTTPFRTLAAAPYATQQGKNTFYVVAEDEAGNISYDLFASVDFYTQTPAPEPPTALQIFDISNRDTSEYAISMKWSEPTKGQGFDGYDVYRSEDNITFENAGSTKSPVFIDTNLESKLYYYYVISKDNAGQFSANSSTVQIVPTGRFTSPPVIEEAPTVTTKSFSANIVWRTDRISSSFIEYGTAEDKLGTEAGGETVGTLDQVEAHEVNLPGLDPETTYYYQAVWVDQDGNQGRSETLAFKTGLRPKISDVKVTNITLGEATLVWTTTTVATSEIRYGKTKALSQSVSDSGGSSTTKHSVRLEDLDDSSLYYFVITGTDTDGNTLASDEYTFTTLTRPVVTIFNIEPVKDSATTALKFSWSTNVPTTSVVNYTPVGGAPKSQSQAEYVTAHELIVNNLGENTPYTVQVRSVDQYGNAAVSELRNITTPDDSRPPKILNLAIEVRSAGVGEAQKAQLVVSWETDEPSSSQVEFGPGISSDNYPSRTAEDPVLSTTHVVIVPELEPAKLYHLRAVSRDRAANAGTSADTTAITGKVQRSVVDIIISSLTRSLGFLGGLLNLQQ